MHSQRKIFYFIIPILFILKILSAIIKLANALYKISKSEFCSFYFHIRIVIVFHDFIFEYSDTCRIHNDQINCKEKDTYTFTEIYGFDYKQRPFTRIKHFMRILVTAFFYQFLFLRNAQVLSLNTFYGIINIIVHKLLMPLICYYCSQHRLALDLFIQSLFKSVNVKVRLILIVTMSRDSSQSKLFISTQKICSLNISKFEFFVHFFRNSLNFDNCSLIFTFMSSLQLFIYDSCLFINCSCIYKLCVRTMHSKPFFYLKCYLYHLHGISTDFIKIAVSPNLLTILDIFTPDIRQKFLCGCYKFLYLYFFFRL